MIVFSSGLEKCCFKDIKHGCFAASIYTLILYCLFATVGSFHIHQVLDDKTFLIITIVLCCFSILMIITSILLIIGLCSLYCTFCVLSLYFRYKHTCNLCACYKCKCFHLEQRLDSGNLINSNPPKSSHNESSFENYDPFTDIILISTCKTTSSINNTKK